MLSSVCRSCTTAASVLACGCGSSTFVTPRYAPPPISSITVKCHRCQRTSVHRRTVGKPGAYALQPGLRRSFAFLAHPRTQPGHEVGTGLRHCPCIHAAAMVARISSKLLAAAVTRSNMSLHLGRRRFWIEQHLCQLRLPSRCICSSFPSLPPHSHRCRPAFNP